MQIKVILFLLLWNSLAFAETTNESFLEPMPRFIMGIYLPGINDEVNIKDIRIMMDYWLEEVTRDLNVLETHTVFFIDMNEMSKSFVDQELDMIVAPSLSIIKHFKLDAFGLGFKGIRKNNEMNSLLLLVKNDGAIMNLADLRGKRLTLTDNDELSQVYIDTETRKNFHQSYQHFFGDINVNKKSSRLILDLFFGKTDAVLVYKKNYDVMTELNPQIKTSTKILLDYPMQSKTYCFFRRDFPYADRFLKNLNKVAITTRIDQMLYIFKTEQYVTTSTEDLAPIKDLYDEYLKLRKDNKLHPSNH